MSETAVCSVCKNDVARNKFAPKQWVRSAAERKCRSCVAAIFAGEVPTATPRLAAAAAAAAPSGPDSAGLSTPTPRSSKNKQSRSSQESLAPPPPAPIFSASMAPVSENKHTVQVTYNNKENKYSSIISSNNSKEVVVVAVPDEQEEVPEQFLCPLTRDIMKDPVMAPSGHTFEKGAILQWIESKTCGGYTCPITRAKLMPKDLVPNSRLKQAIASYVAVQQQREQRHNQLKQCEVEANTRPMPSEAAEKLRAKCCGDEDDDEADEDDLELLRQLRAEAVQRKKRLQKEREEAATEALQLRRVEEQAKAQAQKAVDVEAARQQWEREAAAEVQRKADEAAAKKRAEKEAAAAVAKQKAEEEAAAARRKQEERDAAREAVRIAKEEAARIAAIAAATHFHCGGRCGQKLPRAEFPKKELAEAEARDGDDDDDGARPRCHSCVEADRKDAQEAAAAEAEAQRKAKELQRRQEAAEERARQQRLKEEAAAKKKALQKQKPKNEGAAPAAVSSTTAVAGTKKSGETATASGTAAGTLSCSGCWRTFPLESYSKSQRANSDTVRRCRDCVEHHVLCARDREEIRRKEEEEKKAAEAQRWMQLSLLKEEERVKRLQKLAARESELMCSLCERCLPASAFTKSQRNPNRCPCCHPRACKECQAEADELWE